MYAQGVEGFLKRGLACRLEGVTAGEGIINRADSWGTQEDLRSRVYAEDLPQEPRHGSEGGV